MMEIKGALFELVVISLSGPDESEPFQRSLVRRRKAALKLLLHHLLLLLLLLLLVLLQVNFTIVDFVGVCFVELEEEAVFHTAGVPGFSVYPC